MKRENAQTLLDLVIEKKQPDYPEFSSLDDFFEFFSCQQILKDYDLTDDQIIGGIVDGSNDGGVDGIYTFIDQKLIQEVDQASDFKKGLAVHLVILQTKNSYSFTETALDKLSSTLRAILPYERNEPSIQRLYNQKLLEAVDLFRAAYYDNVGKMPLLSIKLYYVSKAVDIHSNVLAKAKMLEDIISEIFGGVDCTIDLVTAEKMNLIARQITEAPMILHLKEQPISAASPGGFIALVALKDFNDFIRKPDRKLNLNIFDSNIRDYQGTTNVNSEIRKTLQTSQPADFWWLNNGITILVKKVQFHQKMLTVEHPQIVNGLQTSFTIYNAFEDDSVVDPEQAVLIRVISSDDPKIVDQIIRATNSQTSVKPASLRATHDVQRNIETYFLSNGLFYDRRKNQYKNRGEEPAKIVSIIFLGQVVMSLMLGRPNDARARPSTLLDRENDYKKMFSEKAPLEMYLKCALIQRRIDAFLRDNKDIISRAERTDLRFYLSCHVLGHCTGSHFQNATNLATFDLNKISDSLIKTAAVELSTEYKRLGGTNTVAKGTELKGWLESRWSKGVYQGLVKIRRRMSNINASKIVGVLEDD